MNPFPEPFSENILVTYQEFIVRKLSELMTNNIVQEICRIWTGIYWDLFRKYAEYGTEFIGICSGNTPEFIELLYWIIVRYFVRKYAEYSTKSIKKYAGILFRKCNENAREILRNFKSLRNLLGALGLQFTLLLLSLASTSLSFHYFLRRC